ncbi:unnamed protein product [Prorocentrum cordatum]|uniref:Copper type II ascorbate-dependent monooxygenase N-terminal domain-containing protein n=1 Tax=Prorocentrum cordatum TaxID=2364126 RepID=A0ABN9SPR5_9DINO|nr:unnamed protein product [Polarella glacialis]
MGCVAMLALSATRGGMEPTSAFVDFSGASSDNVRFHGSGSTSAGFDAPTRLLFLGDSQSDRLARLMQMINGGDQYRCPASYAEPWGPKVVNHGEPGGCVIQGFGTERCTMCMKPTTSKSKIIHTTRDVIVKEQAPYVFVIDSNYYRGWETAPKDDPKRQVGLWGMELPLQEALQRMITHIALNGARHIFLSTSSPFLRFKNFTQEHVGATLQRNVFQKVVGTMRCRSSTHAGHRVLVSIVHYHKLVCPNFDERVAEKVRGKSELCNQSGPGFAKKMDDYNFHANFGPGGKYLVRQLQEALYTGIARQGSRFAKPFEGPVRYRRQDELLKSPEGLLTTTEICVKRTQPRVTEMLLQHQGANIELPNGEKDVYMCRGFKFDGLEDGTGITSLSVIKDKETWNRIHHVAHFSCDPSFKPPEDFQESFPCTHSPFWDGCSRMVHVFNNGAAEFALPRGFAFPLPTKNAMLQVHYKRGEAKFSDTFLDSTGVRINLDRDLQPVHLFELGPRSAQMLSIPPKTSASCCAVNMCAGLLE